MRLTNQAVYTGYTSGNSANQKLRQAQNQRAASLKPTINATHVQFSGGKDANSGITPTQANKIATELMKDRDIFKNKQGGLTEDTTSLAQKIQDGGKHSFQENYYYGVIQEDSNGKLVAKGMAEQLQPMADYLTKRLGQLTPELRNKLKSGITVVMPVNPGDTWVKDKINSAFGTQINAAKGAEKQANAMPATAPMKGDDKEDKNDDPYEDFKNYVFQERFKQQATLEGGLGGKKFTQFVAWPILQQIMTGNIAKQGLSDDVEKNNIDLFSRDILKLGLYQFQSPDLIDPETQKSLAEAFKPMAQRLSAFKLAEKHYVEALDLKEVVGPLLGGVVIGGGGETALELAHLENNPSAGWIRSGLLVGVDVFDNLLAQIPNVKQKVANNGWKLNAQGITGDKSFSDYLKRVSKDRAFRGPAGGTVKDAISSALMGAVSGSIFAIPAGRTLSAENESAWTRAAVGGFGALGTSLSLPLKLQKDKAKSEKIIEEMMDKDLIQKPKNDTDKKKLIEKLAIQDAMAGSGNAASLKAFSLVPLLSGSLLALEKAGVPRKWTQKLYMSISPGAENLLTLALLMDRQYRTSNGDMKAVEQQILKSGTASFGKNDADQQEKDAKFIAGKFNNGWGNTIGNFVTNPKAFFPFLGVVLAPMYLYSFGGKLLGKPDNKPAHLPESKPEGRKAQFLAQPTQSVQTLPAFPPTQPPQIAQSQALATGYPFASWNGPIPANQVFQPLTAPLPPTMFQQAPAMQWPAYPIQPNVSPINPNAFQRPALPQRY